jgi:hypothetical protein
MLSRIEPIKRDIAKYEKRLETESLTIKQQKRILQELKARPYSWSYAETCDPIDFMDATAAKLYHRGVSVELDDGRILLFKVNDIRVERG